MSFGAWKKSLPRPNGNQTLLHQHLRPRPVMKFLCARFLILLFASAGFVRGLTISSSDFFVGISPSVIRESVSVAAGGTLILEGPGTYSARSWEIEGGVRLSVPGNYFVVSSGPIRLGASAAIRGPAVGIARVTFLHSGEYSSGAMVADNVTVYNGIAPPAEQPPLLNLSTRLTLSAGQTVTSGFVVGGRLPRRVLIRAIGPTLATFGIQNALTTPSLALFKAASKIVFGDKPEDAAAAAAVVGAFPLPAGSQDAASVVSLLPGAYTLQVGGGAGEVVVEVYLVE
jgi:hypothetical protein